MKIAKLLVFIGFFYLLLGAFPGATVFGHEHTPSSPLKLLVTAHLVLFGVPAVVLGMMRAKGRPFGKYEWGFIIFVLVLYVAGLIVGGIYAS